MAGNGRKGAPNKNKQALILLLQAKYPDYHPVMDMAAIANNDVQCDVCGGSGTVKTFTGVDMEPEGPVERFTSEHCENCVNGKAVISMDMKFNANKEVAQYIVPKLKAMEVSGNINTEVVYIPIIKRFDGSVDTDD